MSTPEQSPDFICGCDGSPERVLDAEMAEEDLVFEALVGWYEHGIIGAEAFEHRAWAYQNREK